MSHEKGTRVCHPLCEEEEGEVVSDTFYAFRRNEPQPQEPCAVVAWDREDVMNSSYPISELLVAVVDEQQFQEGLIAGREYAELAHASIGFMRHMAKYPGYSYSQRKGFRAAIVEKFGTAGKNNYDRQA